VGEYALPTRLRVRRNKKRAAKVEKVAEYKERGEILCGK
jgi:hypothetical protein